MPRVFRHDAGGVPRHRQFDLLQPRLDVFRGEFDVQLAFGDVEHDDVAVFDGADRPASDGFWSDVPGHEAVGRARKAAIGQKRD